MTHCAYAGLSRDSTALKPPVLLLAYGAYGVPTHLAWDPLLLTLMERGVLVSGFRAEHTGTLAEISALTLCSAHASRPQIDGASQQGTARHSNAPHSKAQDSLAHDEFA